MIANQEKDEKFDIVEQCSQERRKTLWRIKLITNLPFLMQYWKTSQWVFQTLSYPKF